MRRVCDVETSLLRRTWPSGGSRAENDERVEGWGWLRSDELHGWCSAAHIMRLINKEGDMRDEHVTAVNET